MDNLPQDLIKKINQVKDFLKNNNYVNQQYALVAFILFLIYYIVFDRAIQIITILMSFAYPSYMTFKELQNSENTDNLKKWSIYWIFLSLINLFEQIAWLTINFIPMYHLMKLGFILWLFNCNLNAINSIYQKSIFVFLDKNKEHIDEYLNIIYKKTDEFRLDFANLLLNTENKKHDENKND